MNVFIPDGRIDKFILEDMPYIDLTTEILGIGDVPGEIEYFTREDCVLAGVEEAARVLGKTGAHVVWSRRSGERLAAGEPFLRAEGTAAALHMAWKVSLNLCDHLSGVATKTRAIVDAAHSGNPACEVLTTRKSMPGVKDLLTKAVTCGGAFPHRLGASETVLVFDHHITFMGGFEAFLEAGPDEARRLAEAGVDGIQLDKLPVDDLAVLVPELRAVDPHLTLIAAGGINLQNAAAYAACGVDGLATTAPFTAKPIDMSVRMKRAE